MSRVLVTGSSGHLGEALVRRLKKEGREVLSVDVLASEFTRILGSIADRDVTRECMRGVKTVFHAATLHKPHVATHSRQEFVDVNITGTLNLLEEAVNAGVERFIFTSTTSVFGDALRPPAGTPAAWITEDVTPIPKNIYGVTKAAAEDLCQLFYRNQGLACVILRTSRFFPEEDDSAETREAFEDGNAKVNEFLYRRVEIEDVVSSHLLAEKFAKELGFRKYIISATSPFMSEDLAELHSDAPRVVKRRVPEYEREYARRGWKMFPAIDRVYINDRARRELGWNPQYDFRHVLELLRAGKDFRSPLAQEIGSKGYHAEVFANGPYPTE